MHQTKYCSNVIMTSVSGRKETNKNARNMKHNILANMNVKVYS